MAGFSLPSLALKVMVYVAGVGAGVGVCVGVGVGVGVDVGVVPPTNGAESFPLLQETKNRTNIAQTTNKVDLKKIFIYTHLLGTFSAYCDLKGKICLNNTSFYVILQHFFNKNVVFCDLEKKDIGKQ